MDRFSELTVFTRIAEELSLTQAAGALGLSVSSVSRHLTSLEDRLGVRLVQRTTRHLSLTSEGERFAEHARDILAKLASAEENASLGAVEPRGVLRLGTSLSFATLHLMRIINLYSARYPLVEIDLQVSNRYYDLIENDLDVAIRTRQVEVDSSVTMRKLAETRRMLAAAPDYLARKGVPRSPSDLPEHDLLLYTLSDNWDQLSFTRGDQSAHLQVKGRFVSNEGQLLRQAALDGYGILVQPAYILESDLRAGRLVAVLDDWDLPRLTMNVAFPSRRHLPARTRLFIDTVVEYFQDNDLENLWLRRYPPPGPA